MKMGYSRCPRCGYWAFDGYECHDCGYRTGRDACHQTETEHTTTQPLRNVDRTTTFEIRTGFGY